MHTQPPYTWGSADDLLPYLRPCLQPGRAGVDEFAARLHALHARFQTNQDKRAIFAQAYVAATQAVLQQLATNAIPADSWVVGYTVEFANHYLDALWLFERRGGWPWLPRAWQIALGMATNFDFAQLQHPELLPGLPEATRPRLWTVQHLLLGMNAHIYYDLPLTLAATILTHEEYLQLLGTATEQLPPDIEDRFLAHALASDILAGAIEQIQQRLGWGARLLDALLGKRGESMLRITLLQARERALDAALILVKSRLANYKGYYRLRTMLTTAYQLAEEHWAQDPADPAREHVWILLNDARILGATRPVGNTPAESVSFLQELQDVLNELEKGVGRPPMGSLRGQLQPLLEQIQNHIQTEQAIQQEVAQTSARLWGAIVLDEPPGHPAAGPLVGAVGAQHPPVLGAEARLRQLLGTQDDGYTTVRRLLQVDAVCQARLILGHDWGQVGPRRPRRPRRAAGLARLFGLVLLLGALAGCGEEISTTRIPAGAARNFLYHLQHNELEDALTYWAPDFTPADARARTVAASAQLRGYDLEVTKTSSTANADGSTDVVVQGRVRLVGGTWLADQDLLRARLIERGPGWRLTDFTLLCCHPE